jgi:NCAIR mutase (PurE)-related protein
MDRDRLERLLAGVASGAVTPVAAADELRRLPFEQLGELARVDHHRSLRTGIPEVVFGETKSAAEIAAIMRSLAGTGSGALATRIGADKAAAIRAELPEARYAETARTLTLEPRTPRARHGGGSIAVASAGTSDRPVAEEAVETLRFLGHDVTHHTDVGVAGLQRVLSVVESLRASRVVIAVAGMEGALPGVVASLVECPVIALPTSVGYGVGLGGFVAMLTMLASCSPGISVVNIDNGFGAAVAAARIHRSGGAKSG